MLHKTVLLTLATSALSVAAAYTNTTTAAVTSSASTVAMYGQCGGLGYSGPTKCGSNAYCTSQNDYYYQCVEKTTQHGEKRHSHTYTVTSDYRHKKVTYTVTSVGVSSTETPDTSATSVSANQKDQSAKSRSKATTSARGKSHITSSAAASHSSFSSHNAHVGNSTVALYGQCGGLGYTGATKCGSNAECTSQNDYYYQCVEKTTQSGQHRHSHTVTVTSRYNDEEITYTVTSVSASSTASGSTEIASALVNKDRAPVSSSAAAGQTGSVAITSYYEASVYSVASESDDTPVSFDASESTEFIHGYTFTTKPEPSGIAHSHGYTNSSRYANNTNHHFHQHGNYSGNFNTSLSFSGSGFIAPSNSGAPSDFAPSSDFSTPSDFSSASAYEQTGSSAYAEEATSTESAVEFTTAVQSSVYSATTLSSATVEDYAAAVSTASSSAAASTSSASSSSPDIKVVEGGYSGSGETTRYWDCCKPSCAWGGRSDAMQGYVYSCDANGNVLDNDQVQSGCVGGEAYMCNDQSPWVVNDTLAYGFAAVSLTDTSVADMCCACMKITFTSSSIAGKSMVVQITNTGTDVTTNHFDIALPGGGVGYYTDGCSSEFGSGYSWGEQYGGVQNETACSDLPDALYDGCEFRFDWFEGASNPDVTFEQVVCPDEIIAKSGCYRSDE